MARVEKKIEMTLKKVSFDKVIGTCLLAGVVLPIIIASGYSVISADDFSMMLEMKEYMGNNVIWSSIQKTIDMYFKWCGSYSVIFVECFISAFMIEHFWIAKVYLVFANILFLLSYYFFIRQCTKSIKADNSVSFWAYTTGIVSILGYYVYSEIFYWFIGNVACCLSMIFFFCSFGFLLKARATNLKRYWSLTYIFLVLLGGSYLQVSIPGWVFLLYLNIFWFYNERKISRSSKGTFIVLSLATFIGGIAPGNMARHDSDYGGGLNVFNSLLNSAKATMQAILRGIENPLFLVVIIVMLYVGIKTNRRRVEGMLLGIEIGAVFLFIMSVCFPVLLGYSGGGITAFANRGLFILDTFVCSAGMFVSYELGGFLANTDKVERARSGFIIGILITSVCVLYQKDIRDNSSLKLTAIQVVNGSIAEYSEHIYNLYDEVKDSSENSIIISEMPQCPSTFRQFYLTEDPEHWINTSVAGVFNKDSVLCIQQ